MQFKIEVWENGEWKIVHEGTDYVEYWEKLGDHRWHIKDVRVTEGNHVFTIAKIGVYN